MSQVNVYNFKGETVDTMDVSDAVFAVPSNDSLIHQVYVAIVNNQRLPYAHAKDRSERSGSGRKLWKQKGTGRARVGSVRSPLWRKGGVTFGPTKDRNFSQKTTKKMRRKAVTIALSEKLRAGKLVVVDSFDFAEKKTKLFAAGIATLPVSGKSLLVGLVSEERPFIRMMRNVERVYGTAVDTINVEDLLNREYLLLTREGVRQLEARLGTEA